MSSCFSWETGCSRPCRLLQSTYDEDEKCHCNGRKQIVWWCVNRIEYGTKFCGSSPSIPEEELHRAILKAVQGLAANFTDEVAAQINGIYVISSAPKFSVAILILQLWIFFIYH